MQEIRHIMNVCDDLLNKIPPNYDIEVNVKFKENIDGVDSYPIVLFEDGEYRLGAYERGHFHCLKNTADKNEVIYWIINNAISNFAYKRLHEMLPVPYDQRRVIFEEELKLMQYIGEPFYGRLKKEIDDILMTAPYDDAYAKYSYYRHMIPRICEKLLEKNKAEKFMSISSVIAAEKVLIFTKLVKKIRLLHNNKYAYRKLKGIYNRDLINKAENSAASDLISEIKGILDLGD